MKAAQTRGALLFLLLHTKCLAIHLSDPEDQPTRDDGVVPSSGDATMATEALEVRTPYEPTDGWMYYFEAARSVAWPGCKTRFVSVDHACTKMDLFDGVGANQQLKLVRTSGHPMRFRIESGCGAALSYSEDCSDANVTLQRPGQGSQQDFDFEPGEGGRFAWRLHAAGRQGCGDEYLGFPGVCAVVPPDGLLMVPGKVAQEAEPTAPSFYLHVAREQQRRGRVHRPTVAANCPDPFVWFSPLSQKYNLLCTGRDLALYTSPRLGPGEEFSFAGMALGAASAATPAWLQGGDRWAPSVAIDNEDGFHSILFLSVNQPSEWNVHRIGYVVSESEEPGSWNQYSPGTLDITRGVPGQIDQSVFSDEGGRTYLLWKTDDEWHGSAISRLWMQEIIISDGNVSAVGDGRVILDAGGLWWAAAYRAGASTVEAPELIRHGDYYYLFFSAGFFCTDDYSEGVARSRTLWGPYEKMPVPLLSTGLVGHLRRGEKLRGPGHAAFIQSRMNHLNYNVVFHAHTEADHSKCAVARNLLDSADLDRELDALRMTGRQTFVETMSFGSDGWPYIEDML